ncbi:MAG: hypothetical protein IT381_09625 [Deltaproteobacteria bacterium]|nr:hypothetical protein [Deltaproteobacteria bacterium]
MPRLVALCTLLFSLPAFAEDSEDDQTAERERVEASLEADMEAARARIRALKDRKREEAKAFAQKWRSRRDEERAARMQPTNWPQQPVVVNVEPCPTCDVRPEPCDAPVRKRSFYAEPRLGWTLLNRRSGGVASLSLGGLVRERVQIGVTLNVLYARGAGADNADAGLAYGGIDTTVLVLNHRFIRIGVGALLGGGAYGYARDGGLEYGSLFAAEPHANVEFRPLKWLALGIDGGYRFAIGGPRASMDYRAMSGPVVAGFIRFGL